MARRAIKDIRSNVAGVHPHSQRVAIRQLKPAVVHLRVHSKAKLQGLSRSLQKLGQVEPIVINSADVVVHGSARLEAAKA